MAITFVNTIGTVGVMGGVSTLPTPFVKSLVDFITYNNEYLLKENEQIFYNFANMSYHSMARNYLAEHTRGKWILMLDTDQTFDPDILVRMKYLADQHDIGVLTGLYRQKAEPYRPVIYKEVDGKLEQIIEWDRDLFPIDSAGGGCLFIRYQVLRELFNKTKLPFAEIEGMSEDHSFFKRVRDLGIQPYCAADVKINHLFWGEVTEELYKNGKADRS